jgi:ribosomal protein L37AE/L43A
MACSPAPEDSHEVADDESLDADIKCGRCSSTLKKVSQVYGHNQYICNCCRGHNQASSTSPVWHCPPCQWDVCMSCAQDIEDGRLSAPDEQAEDTIIPVCGKCYSDLEKVTGVYEHKRYKCDLCGELKEANSTNPVWHCRPCGWDTCQECVAAPDL